VLLLLTLVLADELLEDRLEQGNVPMYGQEMYPISPDWLASRGATTKKTVHSNTPKKKEAAAPVVTSTAKPEPKKKEAAAPVVTSTAKPEPSPKEAAAPVLPSTAKPEPPPKEAAAPVLPSTAKPEPPPKDPLPGPKAYIAQGEGSYKQGFASGKADARPNKWAFIGPGLGVALAVPADEGALVGVMMLGCAGGTALAAVLPAVPDEGDWQLGSASYQQGYRDGWKHSMRRRRALYAVSAGTAGTMLFIVRTGL